jgi:hypothetical protein
VSEVQHALRRKVKGRLFVIPNSPLATKPGRGRTVAHPRDRAPGELIGTTSSRRADPDSAYKRFAHLPAENLLAVLSDLIDLHQALASAGWVASDLYDSCLIVDFTTMG